MTDKNIFDPKEIDERLQRLNTLFAQEAQEHMTTINQELNALQDDANDIEKSIISAKEALTE